MSAREEILAKIKSAVANGDDAGRQEAVDQRVKSHPVGVQPQGKKSKKEILELFTGKATDAAASVSQCKRSEVEKEIISFLRDNNLPMSLRMGDDSRLEKLKIGNDKLLEVLRGPTDGSDEVTVSHAFSAAAETGTLALVSGKENPTSLNFLSSNHIVVLDQKDLVLHQEDIWDQLRDAYGVGEMPRTFNFITGPSRSADIQQTLILGAHGPLRLHIIIVG